MHERIKNVLLKVATMWGDDDNNMFLPSLISEADIEKFAKLLIKEAIDRLQGVKDLTAGSPDPAYCEGVNDGMFIAIRTLEEDFEIK